MRPYLGTILAIVVGFAVDLTAGTVWGLNPLFLGLIAVLTGVIAWLLWPAAAATPPQSAVYFGPGEGNVFASEIDTDAPVVHYGTRRSNVFMEKIRQRRRQD